MKKLGDDPKCECFEAGGEQADVMRGRALLIASEIGCALVPNLFVNTLCMNTADYIIQRILIKMFHDVHTVNSGTIEGEGNDDVMVEVERMITGLEARTLETMRLMYASYQMEKMTKEGKHASH